MQVMKTEEFAPRANETFDLSLGETSMTLTLVEVQPLPAHAYPGQTRQPFSLLFRSGSSVVMPQRVYRLTNASLGALDIFLTPVARDAEGIVYQAVFN